jgi:hypothetical protein
MNRLNIKVEYATTTVKVSTKDNHIIIAIKDTAIKLTNEVDG